MAEALERCVHLPGLPLDEATDHLAALSDRALLAGAPTRAGLIPWHAFQCLLELGLQEGLGPGRFVHVPVALTRLGVALRARLAAAAPALAPHKKLRDALRPLEDLGLVSVLAARSEHHLEVACHLRQLQRLAGGGGAAEADPEPEPEGAGERLQDVHFRLQGVKNVSPSGVRQKCFAALPKLLRGRHTKLHRFVQRAVPLAEVQDVFDQAAATKLSKDALEAYQAQYGGSLEAVLRDPVCAELVHLESRDDVVHVLAAADLLLGSSCVPVPAPAEAPAAAGPAAEAEHKGGGEAGPVLQSLRGSHIHSSCSSLAAGVPPQPLPLGQGGGSLAAHPLALRSSSAANAAAAQQAAAAKPTGAAGTAAVPPNSAEAAAATMEWLAARSGCQPPLPPPPPPPSSAMLAGPAGSQSSGSSSSRTSSSPESSSSQAYSWLSSSDGTGHAAESAAARPANPVPDAAPADLAGKPERPVVVTTLARAREALAWLRRQEALGVDTEGNLSRRGRVCLVQMHAAGRTFVFDLVAVLLAEYTDMLGLLRGLLEDISVVKVMHDCRRDCEALFYQHGIRVQGVWDTQVAHGVGALLQALASGAAAPPGPGLAGLNDLLERHVLPLNSLKKRMRARMEADGELWARRPLQPEALSYAVKDVLWLLDLRQRMAVHLGAHGCEVVAHLSKAYAEWHFDESDRSYASRPGSYAGAAKLPAGCDLQLTIDPSNGYHARYSLALSPVEGEDACASRQAAAGTAQGEAGVDADVESLLRLLPEHIQDAVLLDHGGARAWELFYGDNRTGVPGTLHRISAMRGRDGEVLGLTYRIGRHVPGVARMVLDVLAALSVGHPHADASGRPSADEFVTPSLLLLGPPGVGKTTLLRDVASTLADTFRKRVVVVDTSNEIAGDSSAPHPCIGRARRMMVPERAQQHAVLIEACQNHTPQVLIVDEIGTSREVMAAKSIGQRGVAMVGTAHGTCLEGLLRNPELNALVGGVHEVVLGDEEARRSNAGGKTRLERRGAPAFSTLLEVLDCNRWRLHMNVARSVDAILAGREPVTQLRWLDGQGRMMARVEGVPEELPHAALPSKALRRVAEQQGARGAWLHDLINLAAAY